MEFRGNVHPECPNSGNAFHECSSKCFENIDSGEVKREKTFFGFGKKTPIRSTPPASPARVSGNKSPLPSYYYTKKNAESVDNRSSSSDENIENFQRHRSPARVQPFQTSHLSGNNTPDRQRAETSGNRTPRSRLAERRSPPPDYNSEEYEESDDFPDFASSNETPGYSREKPSPAYGQSVQTKPAVENKSLALSPSLAVYFDRGEITRMPERPAARNLVKETQPRSRPMTPEHRSQTPEHQSRTPERGSRTPEHRSRTPEHQSRTPERRSRAPEPTSRIPEPRSRTPEPRSVIPEPYSKFSRQRSRTPEPQHTTYEFQTGSPQFQPRIPGPRSRTPEPHSRTHEFQSRSPEPRFRTPEPRPRTPEYRPTTPKSPRLRTPNSPRLHFAYETKAESVYSDEDDGESVLLFPELLLSPVAKPVSRPTTPDRRIIGTSNNQEEPHRKAQSEKSDDSFGEDRSVYLYPEIEETKIRSASSTPANFKVHSSSEQEDYADYYDPPELPNDSQSFSHSEIARMRGMKTLDKDEFQSVISEPCVTVGGYLVRESVSSTLQSILDKHGDIASGSKLQSLATRSYYLESLSFVVLELTTTPLKKLTETRVQEMLALVRDMESVKIEVGWLRVIVNDLAEAVKHLDRHETSITEKETCDRDLERKKNEMEEKMKELRLKQKEIKECREKVTEIGGRLGRLEMQKSRLTNNLVFLRSKVEKFQGKSVLDELF